MFTLEEMVDNLNLHELSIDTIESLYHDISTKESGFHLIGEYTIAWKRVPCDIKGSTKLHIEIF